MIATKCTGSSRADALSSLGRTGCTLPHTISTTVQALHAHSTPSCLTHMTNTREHSRIPGERVQGRRASSGSDVLAPHVAHRQFPLIRRFRAPAAMPASPAPRTVLPSFTYVTICRSQCGAGPVGPRNRGNCPAVTLVPRWLPCGQVGERVFRSPARTLATPRPSQPAYGPRCSCGHFQARHRPASGRCLRQSPRVNRTHPSHHSSAHSSPHGPGPARGPVAHCALYPCAYG